MDCGGKSDATSLWSARDMVWNSNAPRPLESAVAAALCWCNPRRSRLRTHHPLPLRLVV